MTWWNVWHACIDTVLPAGWVAAGCVADIAVTVLRVYVVQVAA